METYKSYGVCTTGLNIRKKLFIEFESDNSIIFWQETLLNVEALCVGIQEQMLIFWKCFGMNCRNSVKTTQKKIQEIG